MATPALVTRGYFKEEQDGGGDSIASGYMWLLHTSNLASGTTWLLQLGARATAHLNLHAGHGLN